MTADNDAPAIIRAHRFVPTGEWWSTCQLCGLAEAAHAESTLCPCCGQEVVDPGEEICWRCDMDQQP
jgi:hypothetical protein